MASGSASKAAKRELKKAFGPEIAEALDELRGQLATVSMEHRVVAREMHEQERTLATVRQAREHDKKQAGAVTDDLRERVEALALRLGGFATRIDRVEDIVLGLGTTQGRLLCWIRHHRELTRWQRFRAFVTGTPAVAFNPMAFNPWTSADTGSLQQIMKGELQPMVDDLSVIHNPTPAQREEFAAGAPAWKSAQEELVRREGER